MVVLWVDLLLFQMRLVGCRGALLPNFTHSGVICPAWGLSSKGGNSRNPIRMAFLQQENC